jgi:putative ABC transport system ATP-binding protein
MPAILEATGVCKDYTLGSEVVHALRDVSLSVHAKEFVAVMGASGSGKSTLLHLCGGLDVPTAGRIVVDGHDLTQMSDRARTLFRRRRLGIIFQSFNLLPTLTARENVALPLMVDGTDAARIQVKTDELLRQVDLAHRTTHRPGTLSGGEQQRVAIARAMVNDPAIILADEPTGNLDSQHAEEIWGLLRRLSDEQGRTIIAVTHEATGASFADRIIVLRDGRIAGEIRPAPQEDLARLAARCAALAREAPTDIASPKL